MISFQIVLLFLLNMNGSGGFISDADLNSFYLLIIFLHLLCIIAYVSRTNWLRVICCFLYLPLFFIPLILTMFEPAFMLLFIPMIAFYWFTLINKRRDQKN